LYAVTKPDKDGAMGPALSRSLSAMKRPDVNVLALDRNWYWSAHQLILAYKICLTNVHTGVAGGDMPTAGTRLRRPRQADEYRVGFGLGTQ